MSIAALAQNPKLYSLPPYTTRNHHHHHHHRLHLLNFSDNSSPPIISRSLRFASAEIIKQPPRWRIRILPSGESSDRSSQREIFGQLSLDSVLSTSEIILIAPPIIYSIWWVVGFLIPGVAKPLPASLGSKTFVWQFLLLVGSVAIGSLIRQRQWRRICRGSETGSNIDFLARIEKVEEDLRSSATIVRVRSRQLEKLGIRFRVTRKSLKGPISETAALAQKNSEATRALALQEDILEKELGEIHNVLLAMQEQQQKQLELILAIGKAGRLLESKRNTASTSEQATVGSSINQIPDKKESKQLEIQTGRVGGANNEIV